MIADVAASPQDTYTGFVIVGGLLVAVVLATRGVVGVALQAAGAAACYFAVFKRIPDAQTQQLYGALFIGLILGTLLTFALPDRWVRR